MKSNVDLQNLKDYSELMDNISVEINWKKKSDIEQEFSWLDINERKAEIQKLTPDQIEKISNQNNFTPIIETVKFCKSIYKTQDKLSDYAYKDFDEISRAIDDRILKHKQKLPEDLYKKLNNLLLNLCNKTVMMVKENRENELINLKNDLESISFIKGENYINKLLDICKNIGIKDDIEISLSNILKINENLHDDNKIDLRSDYYTSEVNRIVNKLMLSELELKKKI